MKGIYKYPATIVEYELSRKLVQDLTRQISYTMDYGTACTNQENNVTCLKRSWEVNMWNASAKDLQEYSVETKQPVQLCSCCTETDRLVQERKKAKQRFGRAKTKLSLLGQQLIKNGV